MGAPEALREQLRHGTTNAQLDKCSRLRTLPTHSVEHRATVRAIRAVARRALALEAEAAEHESDLEGTEGALGRSNGSLAILGR